MRLDSRITPFRAGQYFWREGDDVADCAVLLSGFVYLSKTVVDGGRQIIGIQMAGEFVGLQTLHLGVGGHDVQALTPCTAAMISRRDLIGAIHEMPALATALWAETLIDESLFQEWLANIGRRCARARTAHMLCELFERQRALGLTRQNSYDLPLSQEQLGDALGLTAVHVNRTLQGLEAEGLIRRMKRVVFITDWPRLAKVGDFKPAYLLDRAAPARAVLPIVSATARVSA